MVCFWGHEVKLWPTAMQSHENCDKYFLGEFSYKKKEIDWFYRAGKIFSDYWENI